MRLQVFTAEDLMTLQRRANEWLKAHPDVIIVDTDFNRSNGWVTYCVLYSGEA